jgi:integrating conjugative element membrane protein (TIGR03747 family)
MMTRFADPTPLPESDEGMRRLFLAHWDFLETAVYGLQLFSMRLGVLVLALPLFALVGLGAATDGLVTWYRRRTSADRESGFIYHRAKRSLTLIVLAVCAAYLIPPVYLDPRWTVAPLVVAVGLCTRFAVAYFKKHL